jgi:outer membrane beta-barrel protein
MLSLMRHLRSLGFAFALTAALPVMASDTPDLYSVPKVIAVQNRKYTLNDELTAMVGYMPMDSFTKYWTMGGSYTHFFSDFTGWEVINAQYAAQQSTGLREDLVTTYRVAPEELPPKLEYFFTTNLIYTPLYTKNLLFNSSIVYGEASFVFGGGIAKFDLGNKNVVDIGLILRFHLGRRSSLKFDFRDHIYLANDAKNNVSIIGGFAYELGGGRDSSQSDAEFDE